MDKANHENKTIKRRRVVDATKKLLVDDFNDRAFDVVLYRNEVNVVSQQTRKFFIPAKWNAAKQTFIHDPKYPSIFTACLSLIDLGELVDAGITSSDFKLFTLKSREATLLSDCGLAAGDVVKVDLRGFKAQLPEVNRLIAKTGCAVEYHRTVKAFKVVRLNGAELNAPYLPEVYSIRGWSMNDFMAKVMKVLIDNRVRVSKALRAQFC
ncbi:MAG: hypothetical protein ACRCZA_08075 [Shewanella sp.]|uniref:hypothetical protein n=1 Tax=Shewanella sp. TaxID=50422 RepID=UPI003F2C6881